MKKSITARHWTLLLFACLIMFGNYYCYDLPGSLNVPLREWLGTPYNEYQFQLNLLYTVYSLPNIFLPLIGGYLIDKLGSTRMIIVFSSLICMGATIFAYGVTERAFIFMALGRFVFGLGGESLEVAQASVTTDWFRGRGLGMALGINLSSARIATALNDILSPWLESRDSVVLPAWFALAVCLASSVSAGFMIYLNRSASRHLAGIESSQDLEVIDEERRGLLGVDYNQDPADDLDHPREDSTGSMVEYDEEDETVHFSQIKDINPSFWFLCGAAILLYGAVVPFFHICSDFFQYKWFPNDAQKAGLVMSLPDIISAVGSPFCGIFVDKFGRRTKLMQFSAGLVLLSHMLFCFTTLSPFISIAIMGVSYTIFASALWPCVPYLVGRHQVATAYGLVTVALNVSLTCLPLIVAKIKTLSPEGFDLVFYFFMMLSMLGILCVTGLDYRDQASGGHLAMSVAELKSHEDMASEVLISTEEQSSTAPRQPALKKMSRGSSDILDEIGRTGFCDLDSFQPNLEPVLDVTLEKSLSSALSVSAPSSQGFLEPHQAPAMSTSYHGPRTRHQRRHRRHLIDSDEEEEHLTIKVLAEGVTVAVPQTFIHHRYPRRQGHPSPS